MRNIGVIMARGGSKRIFRKNIAICNGRHLIEWSLDHKKRCKYIDEIYVSTEDEEIKKIVVENGCRVIDRPEVMARDHVSDGSCFNHALQYLNVVEKGNIDYVFRLFCTSPCIQSLDIDDAFEMLSSNTWANQIGSIHRVTKPSQLNNYKVLLDNNQILNLFGEEGITPYITNNMVKLYKSNGGFAVMRFKDFLYNKDEIGNYEYGEDVEQDQIMTERYARKVAWNDKIRLDKKMGFVIDEYSSIDVNFPEDIIIAEAILKYRNNNYKKGRG